MVGLPLVVVWLLVPLVVAACTVTVPNTFVNGTPADVDQVNANFDAVELAVNDNDARTDAAEGERASQDARIMSVQSTTHAAADSTTAAQGAASRAVARQVRVRPRIYSRMFHSPS